MQPMTAEATLDRHFLEARCLLLDIAAILDRIDRGGGVSDGRLDKIREGIKILQSTDPDRAEKIQQLFSLEYDENWEKPKPREV